MHSMYLGTLRHGTLSKVDQKLVTHLVIDESEELVDKLSQLGRNNTMCLNVLN